MRHALVVANIALRGLMEAAIVAGFAWWGWRAGGGLWLGLVLALLAPAIGFGIWGAVDFRNAGAAAEPLRLVEELLISALAAAAWFAAGLPLLCWALAALTVVHHVLVYALGQRLIRR